jgi:hypothetical protein
MSEIHVKFNQIYAFVKDVTLQIQLSISHMNSINYFFIMLAAQDGMVDNSVENSDFIYYYDIK